MFDDLDAIVTVAPHLFEPLAGADGDPRAWLADFVSSLTGAWPGVLGARDDLVESVLNADPSAVAREGSCGLVGSELELKILVWRGARNRLTTAILDAAQGDVDFSTSTGTPPPGVATKQPLPKPRRSARFKPVFPWMSIALGHADTTPGSLTKIINLAERVEEFKQTAEKVSRRACSGSRPLTWNNPRDYPSEADS